MALGLPREDAVWSFLANHFQVADQRLRLKVGASWTLLWSIESPDKLSAQCVFALIGLQSGFHDGEQPPSSVMLHTVSSTCTSGIRDLNDFE